MAKVKKLIVVRHGESIANTKGIYQGQSYDTDLSKLGKLQAKALAKFIQKERKPNVVIASPLKRTMQTAKEISGANNSKLLIDTEIIETNHGEWEGLSKAEIEKKYKSLYKKWFTKPSSVIFPGGEKFSDTVDRVKNFIHETDFFDPTILVTHDNIVRILVCIAKNDSIDNIWNYTIQPAAVNEFYIKEFSGRKHIIVKRLNVTKHLGNISSDVNNHAL